MAVVSRKLLPTCLLLTLLLASLAAVNVQASLDPEWQKNYSLGQEGTWITQTSDGNYVFFYPGHYSSWSPILATLTKIDPAGNTLWIQNFTAPFPQNIVKTSDDGFAFTTFENNSLVMHKLNSNGRSVWNQTVENNLMGSALLTQTKDGGFAIALRNEISSLGGLPLMLFKTDNMGVNQWTKTFDAVNRTYTFCSFNQARDGGYVLGGSFGHQKGFDVTGLDYCLVKFNSEGNPQWVKTYGGANDDAARCVIQTSDGGFALIGNTASFIDNASQVLIVKTDDSGNVQWAQTYGRSALDPPASVTTVNAKSIIQTLDGGFAFCGEIQFGAEANVFPYAWLVKTDANGGVQINRHYTDSRPNPLGYRTLFRWGLNALVEGKGGSIVTVGYSGTENIYTTFIYVIKTAPIVISVTSSSPSSIENLPAGFHNDTVMLSTITQTASPVHGAPSVSTTFLVASIIVLIVAIALTALVLAIKSK